MELIFSGSLISLAELFCLVYLVGCQQAVPDSLDCRAVGPGLYPDPQDCGGYLQCGEGSRYPFFKQCATGSRFDEVHTTCLALKDVMCNGRPVVPGPVTTPPLAIPRTVTPSPLTTPSSMVLPTPLQYSRSTLRGILSTLPRPSQLTTNYDPSGNSYVLRLSGRTGGPVLTHDQCLELGRQLTLYIRTLVNSYDPACTKNGFCQRYLPTFKVDCPTKSGQDFSRP